MLRRGGGAILLSLLLLSGWADRGAATQFRQGTVVTIGRDEVINDDLMVAGQSITVEGTVRGDLLAAGTTVRVPGRVDGNVQALAQNVEIPGRTGGSLRAAAQTISISGQVGRNATLAGQNVSIDGSARVGRDADLAAQTAHLDGSVGGRAAVAANVARVGGRTAQGLRFSGQTLQIGPSARIGGDLVIRSPRKAQVASGAVVAGSVQNLPPTAREARGPRWGPAMGLWGSILFAFALSLVGAVGLALAPRFLRTAAGELREKPGLSILWGIILFIVFPIAALIVSLTIIGIPLGLLAWALWGFAVLFSAIPVALWIGKELSAWLRHGSPLSPYANLAIGLFLIAIASAIPFLGAVVRIAVVFFGLGMFALAARDLTQRPAAAQPAPA